MLLGIVTEEVKLYYTKDVTLLQYQVLMGVETIAFELFVYFIRLI